MPNPSIVPPIVSEISAFIRTDGQTDRLFYILARDKDIENIVKLCCANNAYFLQKYSSHHWEYPKAPWERVHIDYAGKMLLIITGACSKWLDVAVRKLNTAFCEV